MHGHIKHIKCLIYPCERMVLCFPPCSDLSVRPEGNHSSRLVAYRRGEFPCPIRGLKLSSVDPSFSFTQSRRFREKGPNPVELDFQALYLQGKKLYPCKSIGKWTKRKEHLH